MSKDELSQLQQEVMVLRSELTISRNEQASLKAVEENIVLTKMPMIIWQLIKEHSKQQSHDRIEKAHSIARLSLLDLLYVLF